MGRVFWLRSTRLLPPDDVLRTKASDDTFRKRLGHLLSRPLCRRMFSDAKVKNSSALMLDDEEDKQYPQANRRHGEEIDGNDLPYVVLQECPPGLRRTPLNRLQHSRHGSFGHRDSELE